MTIKIFLNTNWLNSPSKTVKSITQKQSEELGSMMKTQKVIELITNILTGTASTIEELLKQRWMIEVFFEELKQQLEIKSFIGLMKMQCGYSSPWRMDCIDYLVAAKVFERNCKVWVELIKFDIFFKNDSLCFLVGRFYSNFL